jgi:hypothetical protein
MRVREFSSYGNVYAQDKPCVDLCVKWSGCGQQWQQDSARMLECTERGLSGPNGFFRFVGVGYATSSWAW